MKKNLLINEQINRLLCVTFAALFWLTTMAPVIAQTIVSFTFETNTVGQIPASWVSNGYNGTQPIIAYVTNNAAANGAKCLFMNDWAGPSQLALSTSFAYQNKGVFKLTGFARAEQTNQYIAPFTLIDALNNRVNELNFGSDGKFGYESPHGNGVSTGVAYQPGIFYKFVSWVDLDAQRWSFYITDSFGVSVASATNLQFSSSYAQFSIIRSLGVGGSGTGAWYIDDIALEVFKPAMAICVSNVEGSEAEVSWTSRPDKTYMVQYASDLTANSWTNLFTTPIQGSGTNNYISDSMPPERPQRFYRVVTMP